MSKEKLINLKMPYYSKGEEIFSLTTHIVGGGIGVLILLFSIILATLNQRNNIEIFSLIIYGISAIALYSVSSVYHGLHPHLVSKKVMRIIDHCTIYFLIAGTYTPICVMTMKDTSCLPIILSIEWIGAFVGMLLNAIDLSSKKVQAISMAMYIIMGWAIVLVPGAVKCLAFDEFIFILSGGIAYTVGSILYGIGHKKKWFHPIFHIFVDLGTIIQFIGVLLIIIR